MAALAAAQDRGVDVDRHEATQGAGPTQRREQQPGLVRGAAAELDEGMRPRLGRDVRGVRREQRALGAGRVVLGQPGDLVEQRAAPLVVEPLGGQGLGGGA